MKKTRLKPFIGAALGILLAACGGASYLPHLWSSTFDIWIDERQSISGSLMFETGDGNIRVVYHPDDTTLRADTIAMDGTLLDSKVVPHALTYANGPANGLYRITDDQLYWISYNYNESALINLQAGTAIALPNLVDPEVPAGSAFGVSAFAILDNGQLVLSGRDYDKSTAATTQARLVVIDTDGSIASEVQTNSTAFGQVIAIRGTNRYALQSGSHKIQVRENLAIIDEFDAEINKLLHADGNGIWYSSFSAFHHLGFAPGNSWTLQDRFIHSVTPSSDGQFLALEFDSGKYLLHEMTPEGATAWKTDVTPKGGYKNVMVSEQGGIILATQETYNILPSFIVDDSQQPPKTILTGDKYGRVKHLLLNSAGKIISRFEEPEYTAKLLRHTTNPYLYTDVLNYSAGACRAGSSLLLTSGDVVSLSDWCTDQLQTDSSYRMHYFDKP